MCDIPRASREAVRPRWARLYTVVGLTVAAAAVIDIVTPQGLVRPLLYATGVSGWVAVMGWIRANRAALEQADWCACAPETVVMRVITSEPRRRPRRSDGHPRRRRAGERRREFAEDRVATTD